MKSKARRFSKAKKQATKPKIKVKPKEVPHGDVEQMKKSGEHQKNERPPKALQVASSNQIFGYDLEDVTPIVNFLKQFQLLADPRRENKSKLISIKIPEPLLAAFKFKSVRANIPYQTMIKKLMAQWLADSQTP